MPPVNVGTLLVALGLFIVLGAAPASAGGSTWSTSPETVRAGDEVTVWAGVSWAHNDALGSPDDGPFHAYLRKTDGTDDDWSYGDVPDDAMWIAEIDVVFGPYDNGAWKEGPNHAIFTFTVPDVDPGDYAILHCNKPCTTPLGDITWGVLSVEADDGSAAPASTTTLDLTAATTPATTASASSSSSTTTATPTSTTTSATVTSPADDALVALPADDSAGDRNVALAGGAAGVSLLAGAGALGWKIRRRQR